eukprot:s787_g12.t2
MLVSPSFGDLWCALRHFKQWRASGRAPGSCRAMSKFSFQEGTGADEEAQQALLVKFKEPQHFMKMKEPKLPFEKMLEVDDNQLVNAKEAELMKPFKVKFLEDGADRTMDSKVQIAKAVEVTGVSGQSTIGDLRLKLAKMEDMPLEDINVFAAETNLTDEVQLHECYMDWMGSGLDDWPPRLTVKPRVKGFELNVSVPPMRDTSEWDKGRLQQYQEQNLVFDVQPSAKVKELKQMLAQRIGIPATRHHLSAHLRRSLHSFGEYVDLDEDDRTLADYELDKYCVCIHFEKAQVDSNGDFIFDDAFWDENGYHPQPAGCWIPQDSISALCLTSDQFFDEGIACAQMRTQWIPTNPSVSSATAVPRNGPDAPTPCQAAQLSAADLPGRQKEKMEPGDGNHKPDWFTGESSPQNHIVFFQPAPWCVHGTWPQKGNRRFRLSERSGLIWKGLGFQVYGEFQWMAVKRKGELSPISLLLEEFNATQNRLARENRLMEKRLAKQAKRERAQKLRKLAERARSANELAKSEGKCPSPGSRVIQVVRQPFSAQYSAAGDHRCAFHATIGLAFAIPLDYFNAELYLRKALNFNTVGLSQNGMGLALAIAALVSQLVMLPGMNGLIRAREEQKVGQPIHHPAPGELASEDDRMLFLYKLRAFENVVEWLPVFIIHAVALVALGKTGTCVLLCVPYTIGRLEDGGEKIEADSPLFETTMSNSCRDSVADAGRDPSTSPDSVNFRLSQQWRHKDSRLDKVSNSNHSGELEMRMGMMERKVFRNQVSFLEQLWNAIKRIRLPMNPNSTVRLVWDFVGLFLISWDVLYIPFELAFDPEENPVVIPSLFCGSLDRAATFFRMLKA